MQIIKICIKTPNSTFTSKDLETRFNVSVKTIRSDLEGLVELGLLSTVPLNKRLTAYTRAENFEERLREIKGNQRKISLNISIRGETMKTIYGEVPVFENND